MGFLSEIGDAERAALLGAGRLRKVADKSVIVGHGDESTDVFFVIGGSAIATLVSAQGHFVAYRTIGPGDIFGELAALTGSTRNAWVHARGPTEVCVLPYSSFERCLYEHPAVAIVLARHLSRMVADLTERVFERSAFVVRQRLGRELVRRASPAGGGATIDRLPPHAELAAFIGTHREAVTKELAALAREGLVRKEGRSVSIPSVEMLLSALSEESQWR